MNQAAHRHERKETEDLLAGFDRPGRGPKKRGARDFVDYYAKKEAPAERAAGREPKKKDEPTVLLPRDRERPAWVGWLAIAAAMLMVGGAVAFVATSDFGTPKAATDSAAPSFATSLTAAPGPTGRRDEAIPPPPPRVEPPPAPAETTTTPAIVEAAPPPKATAPAKPPAPRPTAKKPPRPETPPPATAAPKPPPRDDFIRDL